MAETKELDVVVFGATGYTGRLVAEYLSGAAGEGVRWGMAGRNAEKLAAVRAELGAAPNLPVLVADTEDEQALRAMCERTKVVLTTVGPYQLYGSSLVAACVETGTDYVDLCGEPGWMHEMIKAHGQRAKETGARIVFSCGFDSIPFDMGVFLLQQTAKERLGQPLPRVKGRVRKMKGTFSGGTIASLKATLAAVKQNPELRDVLTNPFSLAEGFSGPEQPLGNKPEYDEALGSWAAPFVMAAINTRNVHRSNFLLGHAYGEDLVYDEMLLTGPGEKGEAIANAVAGDKSMAGDKGPKPGEGPSAEERANGCYDVLFVGSDKAGNTLKVSVGGDVDPGYASTSRMISECALCLAQDAPAVAGGVWTPAAALGTQLIERLKTRAGLKFAVED